MTCENYIYSQDQEEESSGECCSGIQQCAPSKSSHTAKTSCEQGSGTESCQSSQSSETSENLTAPNGEGQLTLFAEASPAKTSPQPEREQESLENAVACGQKWRELLAKSNLDLRLLKTPRCCGPEDWEPSSKTLPRWGMMRGGECWELGMSVLPINGTGCGSWPTPTRRDYKGKRGAGAQQRKGNPMDTLPNAVAYPELRGGTKTQQKFPTPTRQDYKRRGPNSKQQGLSNLELASKGQLNPDWVEWLMNWPIKWSSMEEVSSEHFEYWKKTSAANVSGFDGVRDLRLNQDAATTPQERKHDGQQTDEHTVTMRQMPRQSTCKAEVGTSQQEERLSTLQERIPIQTSKTKVLQSELRESLGLGAEETTPRTSNGVKNRVDRIKAIGNGQVPSVAATAFRILSEGLI